MSQLDKIKAEVVSSLKEFPCFYIEDKKVSFAIHYRNCPKENLGNLEKVKSIIEKYKKVMPINAIEGKK
ncbi:MAG: hypothetical protein ACQEP2_01670 [Actinomycetota bacterium]